MASSSASSLRHFDLLVHHGPERENTADLKIKLRDNRCPKEWNPTSSASVAYEGRDSRSPILPQKNATRMEQPLS